jgi:glycosyltransferase involved in cell wall biosynthesis
VADGLEAVARVKRRVPSLHLAGFGVQAPATPLPYDEFHASLPQERMAWLYSSADIYLCPSWDEGLSMAPMEAMACGAALVTYDNGGCRDYAHDGETALVARRCDVDDLAARLEWMATDTGLRAKLAAQGEAFIRTAFDWNRAVERMEALFAAGA